MQEEVQNKTESLIQKNQFLFSILPMIFFFVFIGCVIISMLPLNSYKQQVQQKLSKTGFNAKILGTATFNPFTLSFKVSNINLTLQKPTEYKDTCPNSIKISIPNASYNILTQKIIVNDAEFDLTTNGSNKDLYEFILSLPLNNIDDVKINFNGGEIGFNICGQALNLNNSEQSKNALNENILSAVIDEVDLDFSLRERSVFISTKIGSNAFKLSYNLFKNSDFDFEINSDFLKTKINYKQDKKKQSDEAGVYDFYLVDGKKIANIFNLENHQKIVNFLSNSTFKSSGKILKKGKEILVQNSLITKYAPINFTIKKSDEIGVNLSIQADKIDLRNMQNIYIAKSSVDNALSSIILKLIFGLNHTFNFSALNILTKEDIFSSVQLFYKIENNKLKPDASLEFKFNDCGFKTLKNTLVQKSSFVHIPFVFDGINFNKFYTFVGDILFNNDDNKLEKKSENLPYKGEGKFFINYGKGGYGIEDIKVDLFYKDQRQSNITGKYSIESQINSNAVVIPIKIIDFTFNGIDMDDFFTEDSFINMFNDFSWKSQGKFSFLENFIMNTSKTNNYILNLTVKNSVLQDQRDVNLKLFNIKTPGYFSINKLETNMLKMNGTLYFIFDATKVNPKIFIDCNFSSFYFSKIKQLMQKKIEQIINKQDEEKKAQKESEKVEVKKEEGDFDSVLKNMQKEQEAQEQKLEEEEQEKSAYGIRKYLKYNFFFPSFAQIDADVKIKIENLINDDFKLKNLDAIIKGSNGFFYIDKIFFSENDSLFSFTGNLDLKYRPSLELNFNLVNSAFSSIIKMFTQTDIAGGTINAKGKLVLSGNSIMQMIYNGFFSINFDSNNFIIKKPSLTDLSALFCSPKTSFTDLNPESVVMNGNEMKFTSAVGEITMKDGYLMSSGISFKTVGVSGLTKFNINLIDGSIYSFDSNFIILGLKPTRDYSNAFLNIPVQFKAIGTLDEPKFKIFLERVNEYNEIMKVTKSNNKKVG